MLPTTDENHGLIPVLPRVVATVQDTRKFVDGRWMELLTDGSQVEVTRGARAWCCTVGPRAREREGETSAVE
jgi:hypothetical protein